MLSLWNIFAEHIRSSQSGVFFVCSISHGDSDEVQEDSTIKRLKHIMDRMGQRERVYAGIYNGVLYYADPRIPEEYTDWESVYWQNGIAYEIQTTHRDTPGLPDIRIRIPFDKFILNTQEYTNLKRLRWYFSKMDEHTSAYQWKDTESVPPKSISLYAGKMLYHHLPPPVDPDAIQPPTWEQDNTYWKNNIAYTLEEPDRMHKGRPSVVIQIPEKDILPEDMMAQLHGAQARDIELPVDYVYTNPWTTAAADWCLRRIAKYFDALNAELDNPSRPLEENGWFHVHRPDATVVPRNSAYFARCATQYYRYMGGCNVEQLPEEQLTPPQPCLCIRIQVQLPADKIKKATKMLCVDLPNAVEQFVQDFDAAMLNEVLALTETREAIRTWLQTSDYCAFLADGSILPRNKLGGKLLSAVPFSSPDQDRITVAGVPGMGIRRGVTVITGGGYSGKSTLLDAIAAGVYPHVKGDGRELVVTDETAMEIAAEDGRSVKHMNISPFIRWIPGGDPTDFSTDHASGSTSQAANILESVQDGARLLLIDEDRSATNFMIRDKMMKALIRHEPITPYTDRVRELAKDVSSILVIGGSGEYLGVADRVYRMDDFHITDATTEANHVWQENTGVTKAENIASIQAENAPASWQQNRRLTGEGFTSYPARCGTERLFVDPLGVIRIGDEVIDIRDIHGLSTYSQQNAAAFILRYLMLRRDKVLDNIDGALDTLYQKLETEGLETVFSHVFIDCDRFLELPRKRDVKAVLYRAHYVGWQ